MTEEEHKEVRNLVYEALSNSIKVIGVCRREIHDGRWQHPIIELRNIQYSHQKMDGHRYHD